MNQRIQELAEQAGLYDEKTPEEVPGFTASFEKFAELLIRKCAQVSEDDITDGDACCTNTVYRISRQIKKHFGVEE